MRFRFAAGYGQAVKTAVRRGVLRWCRCKSIFCRARALLLYFIAAGRERFLFARCYIYGV